MRLTKSTDFTLRLILHLAVFKQQQHNLKTLSENLCIPYNHLTKIVQGLSKAQIIDTKQGKNGGVSIGKSPENISLKELIFVSEGPTQLVECFDEKTDCKFECTCQIKDALAMVQGKIDNLFEGTTIQDILTKNIN